ncbi:MAG: serine protease [Thermoleophilia bacterium]|nr:serine protease [Thermoleophilia bacterium]
MQGKGIPMSFVNLETGSRTYIAALKVNPNFTGIADGATRSDRKSFAHSAMLNAESAVKATLVPKLEQLQAQGLVHNWDFAAGTGALILNVDEARAGAAFEALRGVDELGRIVRNREVKLDTIVQEEVPATPAGEKKVEWNVTKTGVEDAWKAGVTGAGVVVGFVDTGANVSHEALKGHYRGTNADGTFNHDYSFFDSVGGKTDAYDDHNHGSHTIGTGVGGTDDHAIGMAPGATFIATKVFDARGSGNTAAILKGLSWMLAPTKADGTGADATKAPDIVSNSWGSSNGASLTYLDTWKAFEAAGIIPIVSAGNSGPRPDTIGSPGSYAEGISVGATDINDKTASFSSRGPSKVKDADGNPLKKPDVTGPGVDIISAGKSGNAYVKMSGTSMSAPAVAGITALLLEKYPTLNTEQVRQVLTTSAVDLEAPGWDANTGYGRVAAVAALAKAEELFGSKG